MFLKKFYVKWTILISLEFYARNPIITFSIYLIYLLPMANKLHELLAVEQDRKHKATKTLGELQSLFTKKTPYFDGMVKRYIPMEEDSEEIPDERKEMVTTVGKSFKEAMEDLVAGIDAHLSKEETNCSGEAKAELMVEGNSLGLFSATSLLALEGHLSKLHTLYKEIPTLDTTYRWIFDAQDAVYRTESEVKFRSIKRPKVIVKYEATNEHPAQTELLYLDIQVGKYDTVYTSGRITNAQKTALLQRIELLLESVKMARSKANNVDVKNVKFGQQLFDFIHKGII